MKSRQKPHKRLMSEMTQLTTLQNGRFVHMPGHIMLSGVLKRLSVPTIMKLSLVCHEWRQLRYSPPRPPDRHPALWG